MQVFVKMLDGETKTIHVKQNTVDDVKKIIEDMEGIPVNLQILLFDGKELEDGCELSQYKIQDKSTFHLTMKLEGGIAPPHLQYLAWLHLLNVKICRKCYGRLSPRATRCSKAKCGRTSDIRPKKVWWNMETYKQKYGCLLNLPNYLLLKGQTR